MSHPGTSTVLLTGATGFLGFRILTGLLQQGYAVRAVVRDTGKTQRLLSRLDAVLDSKDLQRNVSFATVNDFAKDGAFDEAVLGISHIIHVAAPIASSDKPEDWENDFKQAVIQSTLGLLESAWRSQSVQRVVITSSIAAIFPTSVFEDGSDTLLHADMRNTEMLAPYRYQMLAYQAGKIASLRAAEEWMASEEATFDLIYLYPAFTIGRNDTCETLQDLTKFSSNWHCLQIILGHKCPRAKPLLTCHIDDVARCHVGALDPKVPGNQGFLIASHQPDLEWDSAKDFVHRQYPDAVEKGVLANDGHMPTSRVTIDVRKTEEAFGFKPYPVRVSGLRSC